MPKCVNCKRPSKKGTIFSIVYHPSDDKTDAYRTFKAICGDLADPCNLNIEINIGQRDSLDKLMNNKMYYHFNSYGKRVPDKYNMMLNVNILN